MICDAIRLADCRSSNYNPIAVVDESHYDDRVFDRNDWRGTNNMQSPAFPLGSVPNPIAVPEESYGYHRDYDTGTRTYGYQNDSFKPSFDTSLSVPPCTQGAQYFDLSPLGYTLDTWSMMIPELYPPSPFPSGGNVMDLNEASKDYSGFYTDGRSQAISFPFIPLPNAMLAYGDHESLQVFGQSPTSNPCPVDETLDITGIFDLQAYYYDTGANPFQKPPTGKLKLESYEELLLTGLRKQIHLVHKREYHVGRNPSSYSAKA